MANIFPCAIINLITIYETASNTLLNNAQIIYMEMYILCRFDDVSRFI